MDINRMELVLMRHGSTLWNEQRRYLGHTDIPLSPKGVSELASARVKLQGWPISRVYCSDLARCRESLDAVRPDLSASAVYDSALRELDFGAWEGRTYDELKDIPSYRQWLDNPRQVTPPMGESWEAFERRITGVLHTVLPPADNDLADDASYSSSVLVVAHGGVIRHIVSRLMPGTAFWDVSSEPGSLLVLSLERRHGGWTGCELRIK